LAALPSGKRVWAAAPLLQDAFAPNSALEALHPSAGRAGTGRSGRLGAGLRAGPQGKQGRVDEERRTLNFVCLATGAGAGTGFAGIGGLCPLPCPSPPVRCGTTCATDVRPMADGRWWAGAGAGGRCENRHAGGQVGADVACGGCATLSSTSSGTVPAC
jgi:hypothetical protein